MTGWTDKRGPVFRSSPDRAWPLRRVSDRNAERQDAEERLGPEDESATRRERPTIISAKTNVISLKHRGMERLG